MRAWRSAPTSASPVRWPATARWSSWKSPPDTPSPGPDYAPSRGCVPLRVLASIPRATISAALQQGGGVVAKYTTENIHTVALVGHGGAGKTTLVEALLWKAGVIGAMGSTERGNTVGDSDPLEKQYGHSLASALVNF